MQRLVRICKFKSWDLNFHYEECPQTRMKKVVSGDLVITDLATGTLVATAHDLNEGQKLVVRTCCQKLLCRIEIRRAENELKEHRKSRKKIQTLRYLDKVFYESHLTTEDKLAQYEEGVQETKGGDSGDISATSESGSENTGLEDRSPTNASAESVYETSMQVVKRRPG